MDSLIIAIVTRDGFRYHVTRTVLGTPALTLAAFAEGARKAGTVSIDYLDRTPQGVAGEVGTLIRPMAAVIPWANVAALLVETGPSWIEPPAAQPADELDRQSGVLASGGVPPTRPPFGGHTTGLFAGQDNPTGIGPSVGGASRFFYVAKAGPGERVAGLDGHVDRDGRPANPHPTVKPIELMRYLIRLVTPPGGLVLDPFAGSGTTGIAAHLEGARFLGVEIDPHYLDVAAARLDHWTRQLTLPLE